MPTTDTPPGPLRIPPSLKAPTTEAARAKRRLQGHATSDLWIKQGLSPELDQVRAEHLEVRARVAAELAALEALYARFHKETKDHDRALRQAMRDGSPEPADERTPQDQREAARAAVEERIWAGLLALADVVDQVIEVVREREAAIFADLRSQLEPALEKERERARLLAEARQETWLLAQLGPYIKRLADGEPFGIQPAPTPGPPPPTFTPERAHRMLERLYYEEREEPAVTPWLDQEQNDAIEPLDNPDETGAVSGLSEAAR